MAGIGTLARAGALCSFLSLSASGAVAQQPGELAALAGQTIRVVIGGSPQGTTDSYARPFIEGLKVLVPTADVLAQNMQGGGGALALMEAAEARPGTITLAVIQTNPIYDILMASEAVGFDLEAFPPIGSFTHDQRMIGIRRALGEDLMALAQLGRPIVTPVSGQGTPASIEAYLLAAMTDLHFNIVLGTDDALRRTLLMAGDIDIVLNSYINMKDLFDSRALVPVLRMSEDGYPAELAYLPTLADVASDSVPPTVIEMVDSLNRLGRLLMAAPGTPPATVDALRFAFDEIMGSEALLTAYAQLDLVWVPTGGVEVEARLDTLIADPEAAAVFRAYVECGREKVQAGAALVCGSR
jgi:tripartite-type tricarboxylate transporter receptor subunit TctC